MSLFGKKPRTAQQKAHWAKSRIMLRSLALGYVVFFIIIPMINPDIEDAEAMHPTLRYVLLAVLIIFCGALIVGTVLEYIRSRKAGLYEPEAYQDDEGIALPEANTDFEEAENESNDDDDYDADIDDDYDDDNYEDDDEEDDDNIDEEDVDYNENDD